MRPHPRRNWFLLWFISPLRAKVNGRGISFFSRTPPTVQFESIMPRNTKLAFGKSTCKRNSDVSVNIYHFQLCMFLYLIADRCNRFLHSNVRFQLDTNLDLFASFLMEAQVKPGTSDSSAEVPVRSCSKEKEKRLVAS